jgi:hypothetical protein
LIGCPLTPSTHKSRKRKSKVRVDAKHFNVTRTYIEPAM